LDPRLCASGAVDKVTCIRLAIQVCMAAPLVGEPTAAPLRLMQRQRSRTTSGGMVRSADLPG
jgi:hypothetical protein